MIGYFCDVCEKSISKGEARYMVKASEVNLRLRVPKTICLCEQCKKSWEEKVPELFSFETRER